ncbi:MAG TPA: DUF4129 domain-containing transglutaminase family protein, partial [Kofleriaceae bacterium]|nr:DUF4129 domain-containing transglutaminase family protein [Kofleriaceae bacterium]
AILLRAVGVPTRNVNGFMGGEWNEYSSYIAVRAGDAHSWDEVYIPGAGWVTFDPTPPGDIDALGRGGSGWTARLGRLLDTLRFQWNKWVIEYDLTSQLALFKSVGGAFTDAASAVKGLAIDAKNAAVHHRAATGAIGALLALWIAVRRRRRLAALPPVLRAAPRVRSPIAAIYDDIARALARSGMPRDAAATPREIAQRLVERGDGAARDVGELTELYYAAEWGHVRDPTAEQRALSLGHAIRATLDAARRASR